MYSNLITEITAIVGIVAKLFLLRLDFSVIHGETFQMVNIVKMITIMSQMLCHDDDDGDNDDGDDD